MNNLIIDPKKETERIMKFIQQTMKKTGFKKVVVGVSGGVDSAVVLALCVKALGKENVIAVRMPCGDIKDRDGELLIRELEIPSENVVEIDIFPIVNNFQFPFASSFAKAMEDKKSYGRTQSNFNFQNLKQYNLKIKDQRQIHLTSSGRVTKDQLVRLGNIMARVRMIVLFDLAKQNNALVCGTENKSEHLLGYYTRFGDEASDIEPMKYLYKTQVYQLAKYLGIPEAIIDKKPTAGLWEGQTDAAELGFTYEEADEILYQRFNEGLLWEKIESRIKNQESGVRKQKAISNKQQVIKKIKERVEGNWFKRELPYAINNK